MKLWKFLLLLILGSFLFMIFYSFAQIPFVLGTRSISAIPLGLVSSYLLLCLYYAWMKLFEKREITELSWKRCLPDTATGFAIGFLYFVAIVLVMMAFGLYTVNGFMFNYVQIIRNLVMMLVVAIGEEVIFRGFMFRMINQRWGLIVALIISSLAFGFIHISNPNATVWSAVAIALEAGIMLGLAYNYKNTLWVPIGIHWAWNFSQGQVFGYAVSGMNIVDSVVQPTISGPELLTGGAFGAEASIIAVILSVFISVWLYLKRNI